MCAARALISENLSWRFQGSPYTVADPGAAENVTLV